MKKILVGISITVLAIAASLVVYTYLQPTQAGVTVVQAQERKKAQKEIVIAVEKVVNGETTAGEVTLQFEDAEEIPDEPEDAFGIFLGQDGDTITLGSGSIEVEAKIEVFNDEEPVKEVSVSHDGPEVTFKVTEMTEFLKDTTQKPEVTDEMLLAGEAIVPGTVAEGSLAEIDTSTVVRVWGEYQDGVLVAELVVYEIIE